MTSWPVDLLVLLRLATRSFPGTQPHAQACIPETEVWDHQIAVQRREFGIPLTSADVDTLGFTARLSAKVPRGHAVNPGILNLEPNCVIIDDEPPSHETMRPNAEGKS